MKLIKNFSTHHLSFFPITQSLHLKECFSFTQIRLNHSFIIFIHNKFVSLNQHCTFCTNITMDFLV